MCCLALGGGEFSLAAAEDGDAPPSLLAAATSWGYQLQDLDAAQLDGSTYDVLVVDAGSGDGSWGLARADIRRLKTKPNGARRLVIAYMNIGEAEDYRYYWRSSWAKMPPPWMGSENCRWKGDHRVKHWSHDWQAILYGSPKSYLGRIIQAGYDGVYLDRIDIFYHWRGVRWQAARDMVDMVVRMSRWAKEAKPGFLVLPQNGEELLSDPDFLAAIDGIGKEDMLFGDRGNDTANAAERVARAERNFTPAITAKLPVFAIEYTRASKNQDAARKRHAQLGFKLYFGPRSLAYLGQGGAHHPEDGDTETSAGEAAAGCD